MAAVLGVAYFTEETLAASTRRYNQFPPDTPFPEIDLLSDGFKELGRIIARYDLQRRFRLQLLHHHNTVPGERVLVGTSITKPEGYWTRPMSIVDVNLHNIHPHIISMGAAGCTTAGEIEALHTSEFREGTPVGLGSIDGKFVREFTNCLSRYGWENTLGLEVIRGQAGKMIEFSFDTGNLLVREGEVKAEIREQMKQQSMLRDTSWAVHMDGTVDPSGETRCVTYGPPIGHIEVKAESVWDIVNILRDESKLQATFAESLL